MPRIDLGYLSSILGKRGNEVYILDCLKEKMDYYRFQHYIVELRPDIVGIQIFTYDLNSCKRHIDIIKEIHPSAHIILGGAHPSCYPYGVMKEFEKADFAFAGEADLGLSELVDFLTIKENDHPEPSSEDRLLEKICNLIWQNGDEIVCNPKRFVEDLDNIDFPAWDLMDPRSYPEAPHGAFVKSFPVAPFPAPFVPER